MRGPVGVRRALGATRGFLALKAKNVHAVEAVRRAITESGEGGLDPRLLGDYYPPGDEYDRLYETTERLIPSAGISLGVGAVVAEEETLANVAAAAGGRGWDK
jgi:Na+-translocating ferredoxin:NAD+ oxidoreductase RnfC subunit